MVPPQPDPVPISASPFGVAVSMARVDPLNLVPPAPAPFLSGSRNSDSPVNSADGPQGVRDQPTVLSEIRPRYPFRARAGGQEGAVTVRVRVSAEGRMESAEVVRTSGFTALDEAAIGAINRARFAPAERGERRVAGEIDLTFEFRLKD